MILALNNKLTTKRATLWDKSGKKRKASLLLDIVLGVVLMMIIYYVATVAYPEYRNNANRAQAKEDLSTLKTAVITYQGLSKTPGADITMDDLTTGLTAAESIDGTDHSPVLEESKLDPWGGEYNFDIDANGAGTISTTGAPDGIGNLSISLGSVDN